MRGLLHLRDVPCPKGTGTVEARLEAMEQDIFRCKGMVEHGLNANHLMIEDYTHDLKVDGKSIRDIIFSLNEQINSSIARSTTFKAKSLNMRQGLKV